MADWMRPAPSLGHEGGRDPRGGAVRPPQLDANVEAGFKEALAPALCGTMREMRKFCKSLDPVWLRARARALRRSRRNVETLKREGRCR